MNRLATVNRIRTTRAQVPALATVALLLATCLGVLGFSGQVVQPVGADTDLHQFVGTWRAQFNGKTFFAIKLEERQGKLTGTASHAEIQLDQDGGLTSAEERDGSDDVVEAKLVDGALRITTRDEDSQDTVQCEMKLTGTDQAELRILAPPDVTAPKPWKMERVKDGR
jgi:hypothetical protein